VYTQNIILAIVAEAYEEAKSNLGTAETSFLMLVIMRFIFFILFVVYRARMFCIDMLELVTGRQFSASAARQASRTVRTAICLVCYQQQCRFVELLCCRAGAVFVLSADSPRYCQ
jgi:hypothetical protein